MPKCCDKPVSRLTDGGDNVSPSFGLQGPLGRAKTELAEELPRELKGVPQIQKGLGQNFVKNEWKSLGQGFITP